MTSVTVGPCSPLAPRFPEFMPFRPPAAAACGGWGAVVTGLAAPWPPSSFPVVDNSVKPNREFGQAESMRWKQNGKGDVQMTKTSWRTFCLNKTFSPVAMGIRL